MKTKTILVHGQSVTVHVDADGYQRSHQLYAGTRRIGVVMSNRQTSEVTAVAEDDTRNILTVGHAKKAALFSKLERWIIQHTFP